MAVPHLTLRTDCVIEISNSRQIKKDLRRVYKEMEKGGKERAAEIKKESSRKGKAGRLLEKGKDKHGSQSHTRGRREVAIRVGEWFSCNYFSSVHWYCKLGLEQIKYSNIPTMMMFCF